MKRKAQIKMFETIAILVVFFFLVGFGFIFYTKIKQVSSGQEFEEAVELRAIEITELIEFLPEIVCSTDIVTEIQNCVDEYKLTAFSTVANANREYYVDVFGNSKIIVNEVYPGTTEWDVFDNSKNSESLQTQVPISIYNPNTGKFSFGVMYIDVYT